MLPQGKFATVLEPRSPPFMILTSGFAPALATNIQTILVTRFVSYGFLSTLLFWILKLPSFRVYRGIFGSTAVSLVGGTLSDLFTGKERGLPMALFAYAAFASTGLGPVMFGYVQVHFTLPTPTLGRCSCNPIQQ